MNDLRFYLALYLGKLLRLAISLLARGRGTNLPGWLALRLDPAFVRHVRNLDPDKTVFITGTNGKSTTTNLLYHVLRTAGLRVAANLEGANLLAGVATTLLANADLAGALRADYLLLETDERFLPLIHAQLPARHICVTNIQKDQVQRNGEPDLIYRKLRSVLSPEITLYLNNDEPNACSLAAAVKNSVFYGVAENDKSFRKQGLYAVSLPCPLCSAPLAFQSCNIDNIGPFSCPSCGFASAGQPDYLAEDIDFDQRRFSVKGVSYPFGYTAPYFLYCYIAALAVAREFGVDAAAVQQAFATFVNVGGRVEDIRLGGKTIHYLRMKQENPETLQSAINVIAADPEEKIFMLGLDELVDFDPHYTNTFYAYDCDFRPLIAAKVSAYLCFSGTVAYDAALRLVYDGADPDKLIVLPSNDDAEIAAALAACPGDNIYLITWLKKYQSLAKYARQQAGGTAAAPVSGNQSQRGAQA